MNCSDRSDIANYVFLQLERLLSESDFKALRTLHFKEKRVLASILRAHDDLPEDIKKALRAHYGIQDKDKKKMSKAQAEISTGSPILRIVGITCFFGSFSTGSPNPTSR